MQCSVTWSRPYSRRYRIQWTTAFISQAEKLSKAIHQSGKQSSERIWWSWHVSRSSTRSDMRGGGDRASAKMFWLKAYNLMSTPWAIWYVSDKKRNSMDIYGVSCFMMYIRGLKTRHFALDCMHGTRFSGNVHNNIKSSGASYSLGRVDQTRGECWCPSLLLITTIMSSVRGTWYVANSQRLFSPMIGNL